MSDKIKLMCVGGPIDGHELEFTKDQNHIDLYKPNTLENTINGWKPTEAPISTYHIQTVMGVPVFAAHKGWDTVRVIQHLVSHYKSNGRS